jgi:hypothetical protein
MRQDREAAWGAVFDALPAKWTVGPAGMADPVLGEWRVTARSRPRGRLATTQTVTGSGPDEVSALRDLEARLRGNPPGDGSRLEELRRRLRLAYVDGAEEWSRENVGRGLTTDELGRVIGRYVGQ